MQLHNLKARTKRIKHVQMGRGGKRGKTSGRGTKGQNARAGRKKRPELRDFIKRIPKLRGRGKNSEKSIVLRKALEVKLSSLEIFKAGEVINSQTLLKAGLVKKVDGQVQKVKILSTGEITKKLTLAGIEVSAGAKAKIEKLGGKVLG